MFCLCACVCVIAMLYLLLPNTIMLINKPSHAMCECVCNCDVCVCVWVCMWLWLCVCVYGEIISAFIWTLAPLDRCVSVYVCACVIVCIKMLHEQPFVFTRVSGCLRFCTRRSWLQAAQSPYWCQCVAWRAWTSLQTHFRHAWRICMGFFLLFVVFVFSLSTLLFTYVWHNLITIAVLTFSICHSHSLACWANVQLNTAISLLTPLSLVLVALGFTPTIWAPLRWHALGTEVISRDVQQTFKRSWVSVY